MNPQQSLILNLKELWHESPRWQNLLLAAVVCSVMAVVFHPAGSGGPTGNSYTPPSQTSQSSANGPLVPPKAGSSAPPVPPPPPVIDQAGTASSNQAPALPPPGSGRPLSVVAPIAPAPIKIKPSRSADNVEIEALPEIKNGEDFGQTDKTWLIRPSAPGVEK